MFIPNESYSFATKIYKKKENKNLCKQFSNLTVKHFTLSLTH